MENLEEKLGAKTHYNLMNGKTVTQNVPQLPAKSKKEFDTQISKETSAANRSIGEDVQSRIRPLLGPSPG